MAKAFDEITAAGEADGNRGKFPGLRAGAKIGGVILSCLWRAWTLIRLLLCQRVTFAG
jgi:hypothetical protein